MKWVKIREGVHKLVEDDDERPAVKLTHKPLGSFSLLYSPSWRKFEAPMLHPENKDSGEAADKFVAEREHQLKIDPKAKRWEESRKASWAKDKPAWRKKRMQSEDW